MFGICNLGIVPIRCEASDRSEMVSQLLFGDSFKIIETSPKWTKINTAFDAYEGWIDNKQFQEITENQYNLLENSASVLNGELIDFISYETNQLMPIPLGSSLNFLDINEINTANFQFEGKKECGIKPKDNLLKTAFLYLNAPYLWGGKTPFGIDCSGFTQMVYKLNGHKLLRDASQQAKQGEALSFIEESEPGDLAFFDNEEGNIIHVGIMMENNYIIHASGKVRIDRIDHLGIYNVDTGRHTHKLRVIKKVI
ncbi:MAG: C40 family peptidase [Bacteroidota bacterium]